MLKKQKFTCKEILDREVDLQMRKGKLSNADSDQIYFKKALINDQRVKLHDSIKRHMFSNCSI